MYILMDPSICVPRNAVHSGDDAIVNPKARAFLKPAPPEKNVRSV